MCRAVSDVDGDVVRCRWAESAQGECDDVCQAFPATLDQVGSTFVQLVAIQRIASSTLRSCSL